MKLLHGLSILVIDDDRLAAFRLHQALVAAGARVASGDVALAAPYLGAAALAAVVVGGGLNRTDADRLAAELHRCAAPWVAYGDIVASSLQAPAARVGDGDLGFLIETLAAVCGGRGR